MLVIVGETRRIRRRIVALVKRHVFNLWLNSIVFSAIVPDHLRWVLIRATGLKVQRSVIDARGFIGSRLITIGRGCSINRGVFLDGSAAITIEDDVSIGMNAVIITGSHDLGPAERRAGALAKEPVRIERGAWIGANSVVLPGVTIGRGAVVGAGSVVMKDVAENAVVMGNPARVVRRLDDAPPAKAADATGPAQT